MSRYILPGRTVTLMTPAWRARNKPSPAATRWRITSWHDSKAHLVSLATGKAMSMAQGEFMRAIEEGLLRVDQ